MNAPGFAAIQVVASDIMPEGFMLIRDSAGVAFVTPTGELVRLPPFTFTLGGNSLLSAGHNEQA